MFFYRKENDYAAFLWGPPTWPASFTELDHSND
jgi:hypothetical protein